MNKQVRARTARAVVMAVTRFAVLPEAPPADNERQTELQNVRINPADLLASLLEVSEVPRRDAEPGHALGGRHPDKSCRSRQSLLRAPRH
jgi:hypothetical protein